MEPTEIGSFLLDGKWPFLTAFIACCALIGYQWLYLLPELRRLKSHQHNAVELSNLVKAIADMKAILENSADNKSANEILPELRISSEEIKALADTVTRTADMLSRLETNLHDFSRSNDDDHRDLNRTVQELHRSIADMNSRIMFISNSLCSPFPRTDPNGFRTDGIR
jgi:DNA repair exonuclease SbcCD ATPase subunit